MLINLLFATNATDGNVTPPPYSNDGRVTPPSYSNIGRNSPAPTVFNNKPIVSASIEAANTTHGLKTYLESIGYSEVSVDYREAAKGAGQNHLGIAHITAKLQGTEVRIFAKTPRSREDILLADRHEGSVDLHTKAKDSTFSDRHKESVDFMNTHGICLKFDCVELVHQYVNSASEGEETDVKESTFAEFFPPLPKGQTLAEELAPLWASPSPEDIAEIEMWVAHAIALYLEMEEAGLTHNDFTLENLWVPKMALDNQRRLIAFDFRSHTKVVLDLKRRDKSFTSPLTRMLSTINKTKKKLLKNTEHLDPSAAVPSQKAIEENISRVITMFTQGLSKYNENNLASPIVSGQTAKSPPRISKQLLRNDSSDDELFSPGKGRNRDRGCPFSPPRSSALFSPLSFNEE